MQIGAVCASAALSSVLNVVNAAILCFAQRNSVDDTILFAWFFWIIAAAAARCLVCYAYRRNPDYTDGRGWRRIIVAAASLSGIGWGIAGILFLYDLSPVMYSPRPTMLTEAVTIIFVSGMAAGALASFGPVIQAYRAYALCCLLPTGIAILAVPDETRLLIALAIAVYLGFMLYSAQRYHQLFERNLRGNFENDALVDRLRSENRRSDTLNQDLEHTREFLEIRVAERTAELSRAIADLEREMAARQAAEGRLAQAQKMEAVGQLTGGVAHDFNNLLTVVQGNIELITAGLRDQPKLHHNADRALAAVRRGAELTGRLLAFSRQQPLAPKTVDLNSLISGMDDLISRTLGETIDVVAEQEPDLWPVDVDPGQFENAVLNLAINARDAMPHGGTLTVATSNTRIGTPRQAAEDTIPAGSYVTASVSDSGEGMRPEIIKRAFEPFFTTKEVGKGSGLGLSMVYGFLRQSEGYVEILSEEGHGTTVNLHFPVSDRKVAEQSDSRARTADIAAIQHDGGDRRILLVEDDPDVREMTVAQLTALGYGVVAVPDGQSALSIINSDAPVDLLFTDLVLPGGMDGREIVRAALEIRPGLPAVYCSGYTENVLHRDQASENGPSLLTKPFTVKELARCIEEALADGNISTAPSPGRSVPPTR